MMKKLYVSGIAISTILLITGVCQGAIDTTVAWNPSLKDVNGQPLTSAVSYKLYFSETSGVYSQYVDAGSSSTAAVTGLEYSKTYFFRAKAYTENGESAYSDELTWAAPAQPGVYVDVTLAWEPSLKDVNGQALTNAVGYKLFYSETSGVYSQNVDVGASNLADVTGLEYNKTYFFKAKAYTASGESAYSDELAWDAPAMPDTDNDGISDSWEMANFDSLDVANSSTDFNQNGISDLDEFLAGINPINPDDYPALAIHADAAGATLSFQAKQAVGAGYENRVRYYAVMRCDDLSKGIWTSVPAQDNIPAADQMVLCDVTSDNRKVFYRTDAWLD
jgi:hypothetical protein